VATQEGRLQSFMSFLLPYEVHQAVAGRRLGTRFLDRIDFVAIGSSFSTDFVERPLGDSAAQNLKRLRLRLRLRLSLTQEQAAIPAVLGPVYVFKIESKTVTATLDTLGALARVVGVETWQLLV
jgi:hypothetical protein